MTVGIAIINGLEALVITDSRVSVSGRQSDSVNKMGEFSRDKYHGVIFGTGLADDLMHIINNLDNIKGDTAQSFLKSVHSKYKEKIDVLDKKIINHQKNEIAKKSLLVPKDESDNYIKSETGKILESYDKRKENPQNQSLLFAVCYDKESSKIVLGGINAVMDDEANVNPIKIGSGSDAADLYFGAKLQGVDTKKLDAAELAFFATNAYCFSTINQGVGGTPKIARISKDGIKILDTEKTRVLTNLSGAYLSEFNQDLTLEKTKSYFHQVIQEENPNYCEIAKVLDLNKSDLTTTYIPYSSWQERANSKNFPH